MTRDGQKVPGQWRPHRLIIRGKIVPKARPRVVMKGSKTWAYKEQAYAECLQNVALQMRAQMPKQMQGTIEAPVGILCMFWRPMPATWRRKRTRALENVPIPSKWEFPRGDTDNMLGTIQDAGNGILWRDDRHVKFSAAGAATLPQDQGDEYITEVVAFRIKARPGQVWPRMTRFCLEAMTGLDMAYMVEDIQKMYEGWDRMPSKEELDRMLGEKSDE